MGYRGKNVTQIRSTNFYTRIRHVLCSLLPSSWSFLEPALPGQPKSRCGSPGVRGSGLPHPVPTSTADQGARGHAGPAAGSVPPPPAPQTCSLWKGCSLCDQVRELGEQRTTRAKLVCCNPRVSLASWPPNCTPFQAIRSKSGTT